MPDPRNDPPLEGEVVVRGEFVKSLTLIRVMEEKRHDLVICMKLYVGVTDNDWYRFLSQLPNVDEVNFWQPGGSHRF